MTRAPAAALVEAGPLRDVARIDAFALAGRRVVVRTDFNAPMVNGRILDDRRIRLAVPLLRDLVRRGAEVTVATHAGNPAGVPDPRFDLGPVTRRLARWVPEVRVLPNLRFHPGEAANDSGFAASLAADHDLYVNEAFATAHRRHASVVGLPVVLPSAAGPALYREVALLDRLRRQPARPFVLVLGGAKVADKLGRLADLVARADQVLVGGLVAVALLAVSGRPVGAAPLADADLAAAEALLAAAPALSLPTDLVVRRGATQRVVAGAVPAGWCVADIGPATARRFGSQLLDAGTVFWNGPLGVAEEEPYARGTRQVAAALRASAALSVAGGGHTAAAIRDARAEDCVTHLSTGGGALLHLLGQGDLPALAALRRSAGGAGQDSASAT